MYIINKKWRQSRVLLYLYGQDAPRVLAARALGIGSHFGPARRKPLSGIAFADYFGAAGPWS